MGNAEKTYKFVVPIEPFVQQRPVTFMKNGRPITFVPSKPQEKDLKKVLRQLFQIPIPKENKLKLTCIFYRVANRGDASNYLKGFEDACNEIVWEDDSQIYDERCIKRIDKEFPRTEFYIEPYNEVESLKEFEAKDISIKGEKGED